MNIVFKRYLFEKHVLVSDCTPEENRFEVLFTLAHFYGIRITKGEELLTRDMIVTAGQYLGRNIPAPFYRAFPASVKSLTTEQLLFDQLLHYFVTYGMKDFSEAGHSVFEENFERIAFHERVVPIDFIVVTEAEAEGILRGLINDLFSSSRPLSIPAFNLVNEYVNVYGYVPDTCASKDTATALLVETGNLGFSKFLALSDVVRAVEYINFHKYSNKNVRKLNFKNVHRKLVSSLIDKIFEDGYVNIRDCFEKKAIWCGLLHHIHYQPKCKDAEQFCHLMRNKGNQSVYSEFERYMNDRDVCRAVDVLRSGKGGGAVLRSLDYLVSRAKSEEDVEYIISKIGKGKPILLVQLLMHYALYSAGSARTFRFVKNGLLCHHEETPEEMKRRRTVLSATDTALIVDRIRSRLAASLPKRLGKVYIDPAMYKIALPLHESAASGGFGCLPSGSRVPIEDGSKIRAFTYWEKVDDIDLSVIAINNNRSMEEFSWRNMAYLQSDVIAFSGDQTSGYEGGSEYFDVDLDLFKKNRKNARYLVFCNNVFSGTPFSECVCRAGYMIRDKVDSGEVYEPKTVRSAFSINCESTTAYLFAVDLKTRELVWLNLAENSMRRIAATTDVSYVLDRIGEVDVLSAGDVVAMVSNELVDNPEDAELIFSDAPFEEREGRAQLHSYDFEWLMSLLG